MSFETLLERVEDYGMKKFAEKTIKRSKEVFDRLARM